MPPHVRALSVHLGVCVPPTQTPRCPRLGPSIPGESGSFRRAGGSLMPSPAASGHGGGVGTTVHAYSQQCLFPGRRRDPAPGRRVPKNAVPRGSSVSQADTHLCREDKVGVFVGYKKPVTEQNTGWDAVATGDSTGLGSDIPGALDTSDLWPSERDAQRMLPACAGPAWTDFPCPPGPLLPPSPNLRTDSGHHCPKARGGSWPRVPGFGVFTVRPHRAGAGLSSMESGPRRGRGRGRRASPGTDGSPPAQRERAGRRLLPRGQLRLLCRCLGGRHLRSDRHVGEGSACCLRHACHTEPGTSRLSLGLQARSKADTTPDDDFSNSSCSRPVTGHPASVSGVS